MMNTPSLPTFPLSNGNAAAITKGELVDDSATDFELVDDGGDVMLIED